MRRGNIRNVKRIFSISWTAMLRLNVKVIFIIFSSPLLRVSAVVIIITHICRKD